MKLILRFGVGYRTYLPNTLSPLAKAKIFRSIIGTMKLPRMIAGIGFRTLGSKTSHLTGRSLRRQLARHKSADSFAPTRGRAP